MYAFLPTKLLPQVLKLAGKSYASAAKVSNDLKIVVNLSMKSISQAVKETLSLSIKHDMRESTFSRSLTTENTARDKVEVKAASSYIFFPWTNGYKSWWTFTVFAAAFTAFLETYQIAFSVGWNPKSGSAIIDYILLIVFLADMIVNFNLAYYNESNKLIFVRRDIARNYFKGWFWCVMCPTNLLLCLHPPHFCIHIFE